MAEISRYDGMLRAIPNADVLLSPLTTQEAVLSSKIEGTQATMGDVLEYEAMGDSDRIDTSRRNDIQEVLNYRRAMHEAEQMMETYPLCQRVIKHIHETLLSGVRGQNRSPGEYRKIQNWIGPSGCTIENALYVPISADKLIVGMNTWESFIHNDFPDNLVKLALIHVEFESIHPFLDGNGRLGRMMIPLFLWEKNIISRPTFYVSAAFERDRTSYYQKLRAVSSDGNWTEWCIYFLESLRSQAIEKQQKTLEIMALYEDMKTKIPTILQSAYTIQVIDWIFTCPIFSSTIFSNQSDIKKQTIRRALNVMTEVGILKIIRPASGRRPAVYCFPALLNAVEGKEAF